MFHTFQTKIHIPWLYRYSRLSIDTYIYQKFLHIAYTFTQPIYHSSKKRHFFVWLLAEISTHRPIFRPNRQLFIMFFTTRSFLSLSYRHSLHSTFTGIKSETKVHNIWVKDCNTIQCDHHFFMFSPSPHSCLFHTDTRYTQPWEQSNRRRRCTIFGWSIATQYSATITFSCCLHHLILLSFIQTLTTLNLKSNEIRAQGAQYFERLINSNSCFRVFLWLKSRF